MDNTTCIKKSKEILLNKITKDKKFLNLFYQKRRLQKVVITNSVRGKRQQLIEMAEKNTLSTLNAKILSKKNMFNRFIALQEILKLKNTPQKLVCFDISHTFGEETVASCNLQQKDQRKKSIESLT